MVRLEVATSDLEPIFVQEDCYFVVGTGPLPDRKQKRHVSDCR